MDPNKYFASGDMTELAGDLMGRVQTWQSRIDRVGMKSKWRKAYQMYFGRHFSSNQFGGYNDGIQRGGKDGELTLLKVNVYRNLIKHILALTTNQKPAFEVRAINSDPESLQQARLGNNILDAYLNEKRLGRGLKQAAEQSLVFGKSFMLCEWDPGLGAPYMVNQVENTDGSTIENIVYEGDVKISVQDPLSVITDFNATKWEDCEWVLIEQVENKWNLIAKHPELKQQIMNGSSLDYDGNNFDMSVEGNPSDLIRTYKFYHKRTEAMPNGRYMRLVNSECVLYDGPIPYTKLPIFRITPGEMWGSAEGYADSFDLIGIQEAMDTLASAAFSNQNAFAIQSVLIPEGSNISTEQLGQGLIGIKYNPQAGKPEALQLTSTPPELFTMFNLLEKQAEKLSGVNSVVRGDPDSSLKSGVALGLVQSMAVQFSSAFQQSWVELLEDVGSFILCDLLKNFAKTERMIAMAGKVNRGYMHAFTGDDLKNVNRVVVSIGNPMSRTTAGKVQIADNLLEKGLIKTPQEYITVMETGNLDPAIKNPEMELSLIHQENDDLLSGKPVRALVTDSHLLHMQEHRCVFADPDLRMPQNSQKLEMALNHYMEHKQLYETQDPLFSMISGEPPAPNPQPPQAPLDMGPPPVDPQFNGGPVPEMGGPAPMPPMPSTATPPPQMGPM